MTNKNKKKISPIVIIPARLESSRLKKKLLRTLNGKPIIVRTSKLAENLKIGDVIVGTDSKEILNICRKNKIESVLTKKTHLSGTDRVYEVYQSIKKSYDVIINLQGDLPVFGKRVFSQLIELFNDTSVEIGSAVCDLSGNELDDKNVVKAVVKLNEEENGYALDFRRDSGLKKNVYHHIGIYAFRPEALKKFVQLPQSNNEKNRSLEQMRALDHKMKIKLTKVSNALPSIDTIEDLRKIRLHFKKNKL